MLEDNWNKMVQLGVPLKSLYASFDVTQKLSNVTYQRNGKDKILTRSTQIEMYNELLGYTPNKLDAPIVGISSPIYDRQSIRAGVDLFSAYLDKGYKCRWHTLFSGYGNNAVLKYTGAEVLFISNVVQSSTDHKIELLRDLVAANPNCLRVILTAGWTGFDLIDASQIGLNAVLHLGKFNK